VDNDDASRLLVDFYHITPQQVRLLTAPGSEVVVFRVEDPAGNRWLLRARRIRQPLPPWQEPGTTRDWFGHHAEVIDRLRRRGFPAPALRRTLARQPVAVWEGWCALLVAYLPGEALPPGEPGLRALGTRLGQLHCLSFKEREQKLPAGWWYPVQTAAERALALLEVTDEAPDEWLPFLDTCREALLAADRLRNLPACATHGDCWLGNAIQTPEGEVLLVDWEFAGWGIAVLDLAVLLEDCFVEQEGAYQVDREALGAMLAGYLSQCRPSAPELAALAAAIRFGIAFRSVIRVWAGQESGGDELLQRGLRHEAARLAVSEALAAAAREIVEASRGYI
jgi:Ser/Thr protein kinase RdoA (MazF antagonist)